MDSEAACEKTNSLFLFAQSRADELRRVDETGIFQHYAFSDLLGGHSIITSRLFG